MPSVSVAEWQIILPVRLLVGSEASGIRLESSVIKFKQFSVIS
jgi:hypothetical protein